MDTVARMVPEARVCYRGWVARRAQVRRADWGSACNEISLPEHFTLIQPRVFAPLARMFSITRTVSFELVPNMHAIAVEEESTLQWSG
jgi:hypothetical protein